MATLDVYRGDTRLVNLTFTNPDGTPVDISGSTVLYVATQNYETLPIISKTITGHDVPISGLTHMTLTTGDTTQCPNSYFAAFQLIDISGNYSTFSTDGLNILPNVFPPQM